MNIIKYFLFILFFMPITALATWDDCVHGEVNDSAPGACGLYIDTDKNGICDHSAPAPADRNTAVIINKNTVAGTEEDLDQHLVDGRQLKTMTVQEAAIVYGIFPEEYAANLSKYLGAAVKPTDNFQELFDNYSLAPSIAKDIAVAISSENADADGAGEAVATSSNKDRPYKLVPILAGLFAFYFATWWLAKKEKITKLTHRRIWNSILLLTFLVSGLLGLMLVVRINFGWFSSWHAFMLYWHVEFATAMVIISFFHIAWHWRYFASMINTNKINN